MENDILHRLNCEKIKLILLIWHKKTAGVGIVSVGVSQKKYLEVYNEVGREFDWENGKAGSIFYESFLFFDSFYVYILH